MNFKELPREIIHSLHKGVAIPALPLALDKNRKLDERRQRALMRYYLDAGAGGVAVGVHTTQFEIRLPQHNLYKPVLEIAKEEFQRFKEASGRDRIRIAGVLGETVEALKEAELALNLGYHGVLLNVSYYRGDSNQKILDHCREVADIIPVIGFYLQPAVGGIKLDVGFWREFSGINNVMAIKIAPFNRYQTLDVVRGVAESGRAEDIALYTGNDDNILADLLSEYAFEVDGLIIRKRMVGGLLGHWAVWTRKAVELLQKIQSAELTFNCREVLSLANQITDCNGAFFDAANNFKGCIPGIHEVLRRQGLMENILTLDTNASLSEGQKKEIDRVLASYPHLNDDAFVEENLDRWLK